MKLIAAVIAVAVLGVAAPCRAGSILPPAQYDHAPSMPVVEHVMTAAEVNKWCHTLKEAPSGPVLGCSVLNPNDGKCYVVRIASPEVRRHELAHCAGWPADHPGGYYDVSSDRR